MMRSFTRYSEYSSSIFALERERSAQRASQRAHHETKANHAEHDQPNYRKLQKRKVKNKQIHSHTAETTSSPESSRLLNTFMTKKTPMRSRFQFRNRISYMTIRIRTVIISRRMTWRNRKRCRRKSNLVMDALFVTYLV